MVYKWKDGMRFSAKAEKVVFELNQIGEEITPDAVVDFAEDESTELHKCFEWDDSEAAYAYRLTQARLVMRAIVICPEEQEAEEIRHVVRGYENVTTKTGRAYVPIEKALGKQEWREEVFEQIGDAIAELEEKVSAYEETYTVLRKVRQRLKAAREVVAA